MSDGYDGVQVSHDPKTGTLQIKHPDNGVLGAIKDAVGSISNALAPRSIVDRKAKIDQSVDEASGSPQTNDLGNQF
jgi:hypothetical protein